MDISELASRLCLYSCGPVQGFSTLSLKGFGCPLSRLAFPRAGLGQPGLLSPWGSLRLLFRLRRSFVSSGLLVLPFFACRVGLSESRSFDLRRLRACTSILAVRSHLYTWMHTCLAVTQHWLYRALLGSLYRIHVQPYLLWSEGGAFTFMSMTSSVLNLASSKFKAWALGRAWAGPRESSTVGKCMAF